MDVETEITGSMTAKNLVSLPESQRYEFYDSLSHIEDFPRLGNMIDELDTIDETGTFLFEIALNLRTAVSQSISEEQRKFFSHKAAESFILAALHKDEFTNLQIKRHFKKAIPILENYKGDLSIFALLVKMAEDNWVKNS